MQKGKNNTTMDIFTISTSQHWDRLAKNGYKKAGIRQGIGGSLYLTACRNDVIFQVPHVWKNGSIVALCTEKNLVTSLGWLLLLTPECMWKWRDFSSTTWLGKWYHCAVTRNNLVISLRWLILLTPQAFVKAPACQSSPTTTASFPSQNLHPVMIAWRTRS